MILVYAFSNRWSTNISSRTLLDLQRSSDQSKNITFQKIFFHPNQFFQRHIKNKNYSLIIGLGDFFGQLQRIKIETQAKNQYGKKNISPSSPFSLKLSLPLLTDVDKSKFLLSSNMGIYNCNWIAYQTQLYLNQKHPQTKHIFFHLPKKQKPLFLSKSIFDLLTTNQMLK
ncbi:hypothetical protein KKC08_05825 [Patescibacteria group bacterium]|nr:hypothetical protein [Patescibacteria group bacterium]MCG2702620.1 hypothetical protein [Candidatus Parcubacteria bacterium]MBU4210648.1 hypothetical protein [Patescibacteria group bacterium]MBU4265486.1 hypothetical protein [Patescibacteria group bacterium]MBU4390536.1 hypothetical protein [Patescibacteria group bacterium]